VHRALAMYAARRAEGVQRVVLETFDQAVLARRAMIKFAGRVARANRVPIDVFDTQPEPCGALDGKFDEHGIVPARPRLATNHQIDEQRTAARGIWRERFIGKGPAARCVEGDGRVSG